MNAREKALADAIKKLTEARKALYHASATFDKAAGENIPTPLPLGVPPVEMSRIDAIDAIVFGMHEGEMRAHANAVEAILVQLRRQRKVEARRI